MPIGIRVDEEVIAKMRKLYAEGLHRTAIATRFGLHKDTVHKYCKDLKDETLRFEYAAPPYGRIQ